MKKIFGKQPGKVSAISGGSKPGEVRSAGKAFRLWKGWRECPTGWLMAGLLFVLLIFPLSASAHAPGDVQLSYLEKEQMLKVTITHNSFLPNSHYIKQVTIGKNSEKPVVHEYKNQPDKKTFTYTYQLPLKKGDQVEVKVFCSLYGSWTGGLVIAAPAAK